MMSFRRPAHQSSVTCMSQRRATSASLIYLCITSHRSTVDSVATLRLEDLRACLTRGRTAPAHIVFIKKIRIILTYIPSIEVQAGLDDVSAHLGQRRRTFYWYFLDFIKVEVDLIMFHEYQRLMMILGHVQGCYTQSSVTTRQTG